MYYVDHRLAQVLSEIRIEQARQIREQRIAREQPPQLKQRLGLWLIARGEHMAETRKAA